MNTDKGPEPPNLDIPYISLGELEQVCQAEIDPREVLSSHFQPLVLQSFVTRIEKLETKQSEIESDNLSLKGSVDFAYEISRECITSSIKNRSYKCTEQQA